jgi:hypothetical protein
MPPVRIKYCGLFWLTRRGYLLLVALTSAVLVGACVVVRLQLGFGPFTQPPWDPALRRYHFLAWTWNWWTLALLLLVPVEVLLTLRRFARRQAEQSPAGVATPPEENRP